MRPGRHWEAEAEHWERWAREPGHDAYWYYRHAFLDRLLPLPRGRALEIGCGEGRVARDVRARGQALIGVDASPTLVRHAAAADPDGVYLVADAARLPFPDGSFDLVLTYNSLMDVGGLDAAVGEAARVLRQDGRLCICVTHPICDAGRFSTLEPGAPFVISDTYFGRRPFRVRAEHGGLAMTFDGWSYPLEGYARALETAGLLIEALREPLPAEGAPGRHRRWRRVPLFLHLRCRKRADPSGSRARAASGTLR